MSTEQSILEAGTSWRAIVYEAEQLHSDGECSRRSHDFDRIWRADSASTDFVRYVCGWVAEHDGRNLARMSVGLCHGCGKV